MITNRVLTVLISIPAILIAITFHEFAHAVVADRLGDKTPKFQGRLTLNPISHIDPIGFVAFIFLGFGWAKPVQTNPRAYKNIRRDDMLVSFAGPLTNLIIAIIFSVILGIVLKFVTVNSTVVDVIIRMLRVTIVYNVIFTFLNLVPLPGFDGFHILADIFPRPMYRIQAKIGQYSMLILLLAIFPIFGGSSILSLIINAPSDVIISLLNKLVRFIVLI